MQKLRKSFWIAAAVFCFSCNSSNMTTTSKTALFKATDFTEENMFSGNIEGPAFDKSGNLYVVNYQKDGTIGRYANGKWDVYVTLPDSSIANAIQFDSKGDMLLADFPKHNILKVNSQSKEITALSHNDAFNQPNDICINRNDQLFASDPNWKQSSGQIWRIEKDGQATLLEKGIGTTNGIELSPDDKTLYVNESVQRNVWAFDVDEKGNLGNKRLLIKFDDHGMDGMKCDREGNLYIARYGKGTIAVVAPDGKLIREVALKGKNCSNLVFGGKDGKTVYVTLQDRKGMEQFQNDIAGKQYQYQ
jgi:gluconolactonase